MRKRGYIILALLGLLAYTQFNTERSMTTSSATPADPATPAPATTASDSKLADSVRRCSAEKDGIKRLACYDAIAEQLQATADAVATKTLTDSAEPSNADRQKASSVIAGKLAAPNWHAVIEKSKIDDSENVFLSADSRNTETMRFKTIRASLIVRCFENTTAFLINFGGAFMADIQGHGDVTFRIDDEAAFNRGMAVSTNSESLGLWSGGAAIPMVQRLFKKKTLLVRATPFSESPILFEFDISGLEEAIRPLRTACHW